MRVSEDYVNRSGRQRSGIIGNEDRIGREGWSNEDLDIDAWGAHWKDATPIAEWNATKARWFRRRVFAAGGYVDTGRPWIGPR